jgi:hypothetical protein
MSECNANDWTPGIRTLLFFFVFSASFARALTRLHAGASANTGEMLCHRRNFD